MRRTRLAVLMFLAACPALAQQAGPGVKGQDAKGQGVRARDAATLPAPAPVIGCTSLANLRALQRDAGDDTAAALAVIHRPGSDLGCAEIDPSHVTGLADHVALAGQAYDCLSLQGTAVCHWALAGRLAPVAASAAKSPSSKSSADKPKR